jgi:hypothetical protein
MKTPGLGGRGPASTMMTQSVGQDAAGDADSVGIDSLGAASLGAASLGAASLGATLGAVVGAVVDPGAGVHAMSAAPRATASNSRWNIRSTSIGSQAAATAFRWPPGR